VRALIVPRAGATPEDHWYQYVCRRVAAGVVPGLVDAEVRTPGAADAELAPELVLVGHEEAAEAIASFLSTLPAGRAVAGTLLVAPPDPDGDWGGAGVMRALMSDDPGHDECEQLWERQGAEVAIRPRGKRFHGAHEVSVLINLAALAMEIAEAGP
jgi:predicted alpha/beta hydrolase family esterase